MNILLLLIPLSMLLVAAAVWALVWGVRNGQFDDMDSPAIDILVDDEGTHDRDAHPDPRSASHEVGDD